jgi:hypothetical protein
MVYVYWPANMVIIYRPSWYLHMLMCYLRQMWDDLPGPWPVKVLLLVATQAIPGPQDEIALLAVIRLCRMVRKYLARHRNS